METDKGAFPPLRNEALEPDPELREGPASGGKVALFAIAMALTLGAVFYALNGKEASNLAGTYGSCKGLYGRHGSILLECPNQSISEYTAALEEFNKKNPTRKLTSIGVWYE